jgi:hypothetical protein
LEAARLCPRVERGGIGEICGSPQGKKSPRFAAHPHLNYLKNFHIYLTTARFAGDGHGESHAIG